MLKYLFGRQSLQIVSLTSGCSIFLARSYTYLLSKKSLFSREVLIQQRSLEQLVFRDVRLSFITDIVSYAMSLLSFPHVITKIRHYHPDYQFLINGCPFVFFIYTTMLLSSSFQMRSISISHSFPVLITDPMTH